MKNNNYRTNRDLFSNYYLDEYLPETEAWDEPSDDELRKAKADIMDLWESQQDTVAERTESSLEAKFIRPIFRILNIPFEVEETVQRGQRRPDYGFFPSENATQSAFTRKSEGGDFYKNAVAVADAKRWGRSLDTRGSGEHKRDFENPSYQIHVYLQETPAQWAVLTDGKKWRLYYGPISHRLDSYYEVDLPTVLERGDLEEFKYFYLFFRHDAFLEDSSGECFLDGVYNESNLFAQELGADLQDNIYEAIKILSGGFMQYPDNNLSEDDLDLIHDSSLIYLYRLIFVLYAESEGRDLLDTNNEIYEEFYSLNTLKQDVVEKLDSSGSTYLDWQTNLWDRLDELFKLIDKGSNSRDIPEEDLYIPAYNGGLFRTDPEKDDSTEAHFLANHQVGDSYLARVIELLTRSQKDDTGGEVFVDYSSLDVRELGSIYEGLLEYQLNVADEPLALEDGEYVSAGNGGDVTVQEGEVYLTTNSGERKATGSYYTPEYVVEYIIENTLEPIVEDIQMDLAGQSARGRDRGFAAEFANRVFDLKILDPAMGSGHFLTSAIDYLAREIIDAQERQAAQQGIETVDEDHDINWARRQVAQRCIYGVDLNPLAVELAKVSLWLRTLAAEQPLAFLDHHLKTGNSLVGSDIETVLDNGNTDTGTEEGQLTLQQSFDRTRQQALEHVTDQFEELLAIDNETLDDIKEMEAVYEKVRRDPLYQHLIAMVNVHTTEQFGLDVPDDAYERMAKALRDDSWADIKGQDWYRSAQAMAEEQNFFHWELEFPTVFYEQDGKRKSQAGFDAVVGNPPYAEPSEKMDSYLRSRYQVTEYFVDMFHTFIERGIDVLREDGEFGYIVPEPWLTIENKALLREYILENTNIEEIVRFTDPVFDDATVDTVILHINKRDGYKSISIGEIDNRGNDFEMAEINEVSQSEIRKSKAKRIDTKRTKEEEVLLNHIWEQSVPLDEIADLAIGVQAYNNSKHTQEQIENEVFHSSQKESRDYMPQISGKDVSRYQIEFDGETWIKYGSHLHDRRDKRYLTGSRILVRQIPSSGAYKIQAAFTEETYCNYNTVLNIIIEDPKYSARSVLAILNSMLTSWVFPRIANSVVTDSFPKLSVVDLENMPIKEIQNSEWMKIDHEKLKSATEDCIASGEYKDLRTRFPTRNRTRVLFASLSELAKVIEESQNHLLSLNLSLLDYLGIPSEELPESMAGDTLEDLQIPVAGVADTPLTKTTAEYESLRIEEVNFRHDGKRLVLSVDISYKIDEDDPRETDAWNRLVESEFETYEAMAFVGLSEAKETLIREFVSVAAEEANGFAGFRRGAAGTISPLDRLNELTLPDIKEVQAGLEQYIEVRERADELEERIERTDQLIDEIVYDLYGLTDEEIEIVKSAVQDD